MSLSILSSSGRHDTLRGESAVCFVYNDSSFHTNYKLNSDLTLYLLPNVPIHCHIPHHDGLGSFEVSFMHFGTLIRLADACAHPQ